MFTIISNPIQEGIPDAIITQNQNKLADENCVLDIAKINLAPKDVCLNPLESTRFHFIINQYTEVRGAPAMLEITCRKCNQWVMDYQKDGPGDLIRCYTDRIHNPAALRVDSFTEENVEEAPYLTCSHCQLELGKPFIYRRLEDKARNKLTENRPAYLVLSDPSTNHESEIPRINLQEKK